MKEVMRTFFFALFTVVLALAAGNRALAQDNRGKVATFGGPGSEATQSRLLKELQARSLRAAVAVVRNAPFSGEMVCECAETLADGSRTVHRTRILVYRDGAGRLRQESSSKTHNAVGSEDGERRTVRITDRFGGQDFVLDPQNRTARKINSSPEREIKGLTTILALGSGGEPNGADFVPNNACGPARPFGGFGPNPEIKDEPLGSQTIEGIAVVGTHYTYVIPAESMGNDSPIEVICDRWYSQELQMDVLIKLTDPRSGESVQQMTRINRGEPDAALFKIPSDYTVREFSPRFPARERTPNPIGGLNNQAAPPAMSPSPVPIIRYQAKPSYTEDARRNGTQGTVVLNVLFTADGTITQIRVVRGLPDGLTEKAVEAARKTQFQPAVENGVPVNYRGNLEFTFELDR